MSTAEALSPILSQDWLKRLTPYLESDKFTNIISFLKKEKAQGKVVYPATTEIFRAFNLCSFDNLKIIMAAQDPYHHGGADGLAFSCSKQETPQPSLRLIQSEIKRTVKDCVLPQPMDLGYLAEQGVLLINASLSVLKGSPNSHLGVWDSFMDYVFLDVINKKDHPIIYVLLGKNAEIFCKYARIGDVILTATHPASAAYKGTSWDCKDIFSRANNILDRDGLPMIKW